MSPGAGTVATNKNTSTASRLAKTPASGKGWASENSVKGSDLAQSKGARVGRALSAASKAVGAFGNKNAGK